MFNHLNRKKSFSEKLKQMLLSRKVMEVLDEDEDTSKNNQKSLFNIPILNSYIHRNTNITSDEKINPFKGQNLNNHKVDKTKKRKLTEIYKSTVSYSSLNNMTTKSLYGAGENSNQALQNTGPGNGTKKNMHQGIHPTQFLEDIFFSMSIISTEYQSFQGDQVDMIMRSILSCVGNIFKESILENFDYLSKVFKISSPQKIITDLILIARRRGGKTTTVCALIACIMASLVDQRVLFFSTGERISKMGRDKIIEFLQVIQNSKQTTRFAKIRWSTSEETLVVTNIYGTDNVAKFYPSNVKVKKKCLSNTGYFSLVEFFFLKFFVFNRPALLCVGQYTFFIGFWWFWLWLDRGGEMV